MIKKLFVSGAVSASALILTGCVNDYGENLESVMNAKTEATTITANVTIPERTYAEESEAELPAVGEATETSAEIITFPKTETEILLETDTYYWSEYIDDPSTISEPYNPDGWLRYEFIMDSSHHITVTKPEHPSHLSYEFDIVSTAGNVYTLTNGVFTKPRGMMDNDTEYGYTGTIIVNEDGTFHMTINEADCFDWDFELKP